MTGDRTLHHLLNAWNRANDRARQQFWLKIRPAEAHIEDWRCVQGHDKCSEMYSGPDCPYCEPIYDAAREPLAKDREHLTVTGKFQSDKYPWCPAGFVALTTSDPMARDLLAEYAGRRREVDPAFADDLLEALKLEALK